MLEYLPLILFASVFILILIGFPVAFTLGGVSIIFGILFFDIDFFYLLSLRVYGTMQNFVLIAVPLFIFMGITLQKSGIAEELLETLGFLFGKFRGGLAMSVVVVGTMLAASTGIVGATVVTMGLISLPTMLKKGYSPVLSTGAIASSGTLGQIIPPSVVLVLLGSVLNVSVGDLFIAAVIPGFTLVVLYLLYLWIVSKLNPQSAPAMTKEEIVAFKKDQLRRKIITSFLFPILLILAVLGSIFTGIASPTEAAGVGAFGAMALTLANKKLNLTMLKEIMRETTLLTSMVFMILVGATAFSLVFRGLEGDRFFLSLIENSELSPMAFLILVMILVFIAGFFIDFIEITFIIVPIVAPLFIAMGFDLIWVGILIAINLQTSFLTPPFGFALFYLKGVAPEGVRTVDIYKGVIPYIVIQLLLLVLIITYDEIVLFLPGIMGI